MVKRTATLLPAASERCRARQESLPPLQDEKAVSPFLFNFTHPFFSNPEITGKSLCIFYMLEITIGLTQAIPASP